MYASSRIQYATMYNNHIILHYNALKNLRCVTDMSQNSSTLPLNRYTVNPVLKVKNDFVVNWVLYVHKVRNTF